MKNNFYQCNKWNRIMIRESDKKRIKSYCDEMKKDGIHRRNGEWVHWRADG